LSVMPAPAMGSPAPAVRISPSVMPSPSFLVGHSRLGFRAASLSRPANPAA
jgi:hypothetical protein